MAARDSRTPSPSGANDPAGLPRRAFDDVFTAAYDELRCLAASVKRNDPGATLTPTALVNEAWIKLARSPEVANTSVLHFKRIAARAMRQVLVEAARRRYAQKRGGREAAFVTFDDSIAESAGSDVLGLDAALEELALASPRQAALVEARFFGGLEVSEAAELLGVSPATALRDWRAARAWLAQRLRRAE